MKRCVPLLLFSFLLLPLFARPALAATITLPRTGQTSCWDAAGASTPCAGSGEDGDLQTGNPWPTPRFLDNGDQTISDRLTGLVWSKNANPAKTPQTWQQALDYVKSLNSSNYNGHNDWRLPDINELRSLADAQQGDLASWLNSQAFSGVQGGSYWSSDSDSYATGNAWYIGMDSGYVYSDAKSWSNYVWPVRGGNAGTVVAQTGQSSCWDATGASVSCTGTGQDGATQSGSVLPATRFANNSDQTVTDNLTGLIWAQDADVMKTRDPSFDTDYLTTNSWESANDGAVSWQHALDYIRKLNGENYLGHSDWRLPNRDELATLLDWQYGYPAVWLTVWGFSNVPADYFWSSTNDPLYTDAAWFVDMGSGYIDSYYKTDNHYVWPVRGGMLTQSIAFAPPAAATYGDPAITFSATASSGLAVNFTLANGPATLSGNVLTITGAGAITVKASQSGNANYAAAQVLTSTISVAPKALTITAANASRAYGAANPANPGFTAPALVGGDSVASVTYSYAATATATAAVGTTHGITPSAAVFASGTATNYAISYVAGTLTVAGTASQTIAFAPPVTATYGDSPLALTATATSGLPVSFTLVSGPATLSGSTITITGVGTITVRASQIGNLNYSAAADIVATIVVLPKPLIITAANASRAYGAANPANPGFTAPALVGGDSVASVTYSYAATATATAAVGTTHAITPSAAVFASGTATNYAISYVAGTLTVAGTASQTIAFIPPVTATYGDSSLVLTATATSGLPVSFTLVSGPATLSGSSLTITGVGTITVRASQAGNIDYAAAANVAATIGVSAKVLTVSAVNATRAYGAANPANPGFTTSGLVAGDSIAGVSYSYATTATAVAPVGTTHSITPGAAIFASGSSANYIINYLAGTLTIAGTGSQTIGFTPPVTAIYGDSPLALTATATSGLPVSFTLVSGPATLSGSTLMMTGVGTITVRASQIGNLNYSAAADIAATIVVLPKPLTITAANASRAYGAANPANPGFTAPALVGNDSITAVTYTYAATATTTAAVGTTHGITPSAAAFASGTATNYAISYQAGTLTITGPAEVIKPTLNISALSTGSLTDNPVLNVAGSVTDPVGIASLTINNASVPVAADGSFSSVLLLSAGANTITTIATDNLNNITTDTRMITLDQSSPVLTVLTPADNSVTSQSSVTVTGTVSETATVTARVGSGSWQTAQVNGTSFSILLMLASGQNTIEVSATDTAGNSVATTAKRTVIVDDSKPSLAITAPNEDITTEQNSYLLTGTVSDPDTAALVTVSVDGQIYTPVVTSGTFSQKLTFSTMKQYAVTVTALDQAGNSVTAQRNILYSMAITGNATGDVDGDGKVDIKDALRALQISVGLVIPSSGELARGDVGPLVNGNATPDGQIDISDTLLILERAVGLAIW
jgi:hypothetical protein